MDVSEKGAWMAFRIAKGVLLHIDIDVQQYLPALYCRHLQLLQPWRRCVEVGDCRIGRSGPSNLPGKMSIEGQPIMHGRAGLRLHSPPRNVASISNRKSKLFISSGCWFRLKDRRRQAVVKILSPSFLDKPGQQATIIRCGKEQRRSRLREICHSLSHHGGPVLFITISATERSA